MDESVSKEPLTLSGLYIDLFDKDLPVLTSKQIQPGEQGYLYDLNKVSGKIKAKVLCGLLVSMMRKSANKVTLL